MAIFRKTKLAIYVFLVFTTLSSNSFPSPAPPELYPYADYCASFVPEPNSNIYRGLSHFPYLHTGFYYYTGDATDITPHRKSSFDYPQVINSIQFLTLSSELTDVQGLLKLHATLSYEIVSTFYYEGINSRSSLPQYPGEYRSRAYQGRKVSFGLKGFWSETSGNLCMVGPGYSYSKQGTSVKHPAVLKLYNLTNSTSLTSLISGTLESLIPSSDIMKDPRYFSPMTILMLPQLNYQFTLDSNRSGDNNFSGGTDGHDHPSSLPLEGFCSLSREILTHEFDLKYSSKCVSAKNCAPLGGSDHLPRLLSFKEDIDCNKDKRRLRVLVEFAESTNNWHQRPFNPTKTLVAEGSWDAKKREIHFVACQFINAAEDSLNNSKVGDCSTRLSLSFPAIWTIGHISSVVGHIWSNKSKTEPGYFEKITFETRQSEAGKILVPGPRYEYTKTDEVNKLCPRKKTAANRHKTNMYPSAYSYDMRFDMSTTSSMGEVAWGSSGPLSVGNQFYEQYVSSTQYSNSLEPSYSNSVLNGSISEKYHPIPPMSSPMISNSYNSSNPTNISYRISIQFMEWSDGKSSNKTTHIREMQIMAEGVYDDTEGSLCMIGCRHVGVNSNEPTKEDSVDCEILVNIHFPSADQSSKNRGFIKVSIESKRKKLDPLHFERLDFASAVGYMIDAEQSIWRMDMEITLVLVSTTLACVCVALQLFHVKKNPDVLPSISILMLLILTLGYMIPLVLNFNAMFTHNTSRQDVLLGSGGWLEVNEVIVRVITMVAFLLKFRLLQQTWSARSAKGKQKELWNVEKRVLPLYAIGVLAAMALMMHSSHQVHPILGALKAYGGLVLDGFLLPQILLNMVCKSKENALSVSFYFGTTLVRVLPHSYDLYRTHTYSHRQLDESYIYASPVADFYSTSWDVIIPIGGLLFSLIIFSQQKFGGRCFLPQKLREMGSYEKVSTASEVELPK